MLKFCLLLVLLISCNSIQKSLDGTYTSQERDVAYQLELKSEDEFSLTKNYASMTSGCKGKWMLLSADSILLKCDDSKLEEELFRGYIKRKELVAVVKDATELKFGTLILKKVK